jgi:hypothetical protein
MLQSLTKCQCLAVKEHDFGCASYAWVQQNVRLFASFKRPRNRMAIVFGVCRVLANGCAVSVDVAKSTRERRGANQRHVEAKTLGVLNHSVTRKSAWWTLGIRRKHVKVSSVPIQKLTELSSQSTNHLRSSVCLGLVLQFIRCTDHLIILDAVVPAILPQMKRIFSKQQTLSQNSEVNTVNYKNRQWTRN